MQQFDDVMLFIKGDDYVYIGTYYEYGFYGNRNVHYYDSDKKTSFNIEEYCDLDEKINSISFPFSYIYS